MINRIGSINTATGLNTVDAEETPPTERRLSLDVDVLRSLSDSDIGFDPQGWIRRPITWSCPLPTEYGSCRCPVEDK